MDVGSAVAALGLKVEDGNLVAATANLDKFAKASGTAEKAADNLSGASKRSGEGTRQMAQAAQLAESSAVKLARGIAETAERAERAAGVTGKASRAAQEYAETAEAAAKTSDAVARSQHDAAEQRRAGADQMELFGEGAVTAKRRLVPKSEVKEMLDFLRAEGLSIATVDIRADGVTFYPPATSPAGTAYDLWKAQDQNRDRPARRQ